MKSSIILLTLFLNFSIVDSVFAITDEPVKLERTPADLKTVWSVEAAKELLIGRGPIKDIRGYEGKSVLHFAAENPKSDIFQYLLEQGADVNLLDDNGSRPLHILSEFNNLDLIKYAVKNGAVDSVNNKGQLALNIADNYSRFTPFNEVRNMYPSLSERNLSSIENHEKNSNHFSIPDGNYIIYLERHGFVEIVNKDDRSESRVFASELEIRNAKKIVAILSDPEKFKLEEYLKILQKDQKFELSYVLTPAKAGEIHSMQRLALRALYANDHKYKENLAESIYDLDVPNNSQNNSAHATSAQ